MGSNNRVLITTSSFAEESSALLDLLTNEGFQVVLNPWKRRLKEQELSELLERHKPVGLLAGTEPITRGILSQAKEHLQIISRVGVGWDNIDHAAAEEFGILLYRTTGVLTQSVAELTLGLMLAALRSITLHDRNIRERRWEKRMGGLLAGKLVGIIGFGAIGKLVGELVKAFGAEVIFYDPQPIASVWQQTSSLNELLLKAEIISLHASGNTKLLGLDELGLIAGRNVIIVNTSRGILIDEKILLEHLKAGQIAYACLDVFAEEPYSGPLGGLDNVILTPHIGSYAREARIAMEEAAILNMIAGFRRTAVR